MSIPRLPFNGIFYSWSLVIPDHWSEKKQFAANLVERLLPLYYLCPNLPQNRHHLVLPLFNASMVLTTSSSLGKKQWMVMRCLAEWTALLASSLLKIPRPSRTPNATASLMNIGQRLFELKGSQPLEIVDKTFDIFCNAAYCIHQIQPTKPTYLHLLTALTCQEALQCGVKIFKLYQWYHGRFQPANPSELFFLFFDPCCKAILCFARLCQTLHAWDQSKPKPTQTEIQTAALLALQKQLHPPLDDKNRVV